MQRHAHAKQQYCAARLMKPSFSNDINCNALRRGCQYAHIIDHTISDQPIKSIEWQSFLHINALALGNLTPVLGKYEVQSGKNQLLLSALNLGGKSSSVVLSLFAHCNDLGDLRIKFRCQGRPSFCRWDV